MAQDRIDEEQAQREQDESDEYWAARRMQNHGERSPGLPELYGEDEDLDCEEDAGGLRLRGGGQPEEDREGQMEEDGLKLLRMRGGMPMWKGMDLNYHQIFYDMVKQRIPTSPQPCFPDI